MKTLSPPLPHAPAGKTVAVPMAGPRIRNAPNLARPWKFPAGHADNILCRQHSRFAVNIPVAIVLYRQDGSPFDRGTGVIQDLSYTGLRLCDVSLAQGRLLATYFAVDLRLSGEAPGGQDIAGRILRTYTTGFPGFGIKFLFPGSGAAERLRSSRF